MHVSRIHLSTLTNQQLDGLHAIRAQGEALRALWRRQCSQEGVEDLTQEALGITPSMDGMKKFVALLVSGLAEGLERGLIEEVMLETLPRGLYVRLTNQPPLADHPSPPSFLRKVIGGAADIFSGLVPPVLVPPVQH